MVRIVEKEISIKEPQKKENFPGKWKQMESSSIEKIYFEMYYDATRRKTGIIFFCYSFFQFVSNIGCCLIFVISSFFFSFITIILY